MTAPWRITELLMESGTASRARISKVTGYSRPTVSEAVDLLLRNRIVQETQKVATGGRRATLLEVRSDLGCVAAIDLSPTKTRLGLFGLQGERIDTFVQPTASGNVDVFLAECLDRARRRCRVPVLGVAVGVPGVVERVAGRVELIPGLADGKGISAERLEARFKAPVALENDANAAALGELSVRKHGVKSFVFVSIGTGIGAGIVLDGHLLRGFRGGAGEVGYMLLDPRWRHRDPREFGRLEQLASARGLERAMHAHGRALQAEAVVAAAYGGDPQALQAARAFAHWIAMATANIQVLLDPEMIIFGKGVSARETGDFLLRLIRDEIATLIPRPPVLERSILGEDATLVGLAKLAQSGARERLLSELGS